MTSTKSTLQTKSRCQTQICKKAEAILGPRPLCPSVWAWHTTYGMAANALAPAWQCCTVMGSKAIPVRANTSRGRLPREMGVDPSCSPARKAMVSNPISISTVLTCMHPPHLTCHWQTGHVTPSTTPLHGPAQHLGTRMHQDQEEREGSGQGRTCHRGTSSRA